MSKLRWMRTQMMDMPLLIDGVERLRVMRAVRSDGQMFAAWDRLGPDLEITLRQKLDTMLNDPALPPVQDKETGEWSRPLVSPDFGKGQMDWREEPEP